MSGPEPKPLFIDTGAFYAKFDGHASRHDRAASVFSKISSGDLFYRPLYTSGYVLGELVSILLRKRNHATAMAALETVRHSSSIIVLHPNETTFANACDQFYKFDDQHITFVDHLTGVLAAEREVEHIFAFDSDFRTLGYTLVPDDTGDA